jgi:hypothetical protein
MIEGYDYNVVGIGNPDHPANRPEPEQELIPCDCCGFMFEPDQLIIDRVNGKDTGWRWCEGCYSEMEEMA